VLFGDYENNPCGSEDHSAGQLAECFVGKLPDQISEPDSLQSDKVVFANRRHPSDELNS
jgi:hypothetical protein